MVRYRPMLEEIDNKHTTEINNEPNWVKLQSITQERALDEFLSTAELAGTEFTAGNFLISRLFLMKNAKTSKLFPLILLPTHTSLHHNKRRRSNENILRKKQRCEYPEGQHGHSLPLPPNLNDLRGMPF